MALRGKEAAELGKTPVQTGLAVSAKQQSNRYMTNYLWNDKTSQEHKAILEFLSKAEDRIRDKPGRVPFKQEQRHLVISWLRAVLDIRPDGKRIPPNDAAQ
jgi:hypothetical protein